MAFEKIHNEGEPFYYQIGSVWTRNPWERPTYDRVVSFFQEPIVNSILEKYNADICGGCLWDMEGTWDLDLSFYDHYLNIDYGTINWKEVEEDINKINDIALNQFFLLVDVTLRDDRFSIPTKKEILEEYRKDNPTFPINVNFIAKIGYSKKVVNDVLGIYDIEKTDIKIRKKVTDGYLYLIEPEFFRQNTIEMIMTSQKEELLHHINYREFMEMGKENFEKITNF